MINITTKYRSAHTVVKWDGSSYSRLSSGCLKKPAREIEYLSCGLFLFAFSAQQPI